MHSPAQFPAQKPPVPALQTHVQLYWLEGKQEHWLRFGAPISDTIIDRHRRNLTFNEGQLFAFVRWASNEYGTIRSLLDIVRCVRSGERFTTLAGVHPGGDILLSISGWPKVERVFLTVDAIEASGIDPCDVAPDHWRHVHNRFAVAQAPRNYSPARHRAWLQRKALLP
jgi:Protein of unknown function (DUF2840)